MVSAVPGGVPTGELQGFEEGMSTVLTGNDALAAEQDAANLGRLSANAGKGAQTAEDGMGAAQKAIELSNAEAREASTQVSSIKDRLTSVLSGQGIVAERERERAREQGGKLFEALAAGPESLLEAQAVVGSPRRWGAPKRASLEHRRISDQLRSLYTEADDLEAKRAILRARHYALGRQVGQVLS